MWLGIAIAVCLGIWLLLNLKTSRPDGTYLKQVHPYRTMMQYVMPTRAESIVFYDLEVKADALLDYAKQARTHFDADVTHCLVAAVAIGIKEAPEMNRFPIGRRLYQRNGLWITFAMKRKKLDKKAKLATVKKEIPDNVNFSQLCTILNEEIATQRTDKVTYHDKEYNLLTSIPRPFLNLGVRFLQWLDYNNVLPGGFIKDDPMYTSVFLANLGSLGMSAGYHHLYEWGNCPLFAMVGKVEERPAVVDGKLVVQKVIPMRFTYDERIDDGLTASAGLKAVQRALEDPFAAFGCLAEDGSDTHPLGFSDAPTQD